MSDRKEYFKKYYEKNKQKYKDYTISIKESIEEYRKEYYLKNKEYLLNYNSKWAAENEEYRKEYLKKYYEDNKETFKETYEKNKISNNQRNKERRQTEPLYKLKGNISSLIRQSLKLKGYMKESRTYEILGCSYDELKLHLENQFTEWMNWENYGNPTDGLIELNKTWDIDHIKPLSSATNEEELLQLNHYTNLQPLCSYHNRYIKRDN